MVEGDLHRPLADDEEYMLWFSADDEEHNDELVSRFERDRSAPDYERRITGLLRRAYERTCAIEPEAPAMWKDGYDVLRRGDHYLVFLLKPVMKPSAVSRLRRALGRT